MKNKIVVVGSTNMDMVVKTGHIPKPGETVLGGTFFMNPGGKGANQAVAVARLGGDVTFISKIGNDIFGKQSSKIFDDEGVDIGGIYAEMNSPSGIALITVDDKGENSIVVAPGANAFLNEANVQDAFDKYPQAGVLLVQLEIPMETVEAAIRYARSKQITVILNPAPMNAAVSKLLDKIDIITPNAHEAEALSKHPISDVDSAIAAAKKIQALGVKTVIITLGEEGAILLTEDDVQHIEAPKVEAVDSTAAGDVFNGAFAVALSEGKSLKNAVTFACRAAAIAVTKMGAQSSIPYRNEILLTYFD
ncbi:ribokinase [Sphingobacterium sp. BN32]|uniref:ribokinase n=1 Tax=Sphingobacterium sp. BN32 TaxID=3058432 RepID=UPI00265D30A2|nr:ribokinase [Sphingobacterium sp. BN32]WKK58734.1 ribokinase [Sphingobacterium sp. BN32]